MFLLVSPTYCLLQRLQVIRYIILELLQSNDLTMLYCLRVEVLVYFLVTFICMHVLQCLELHLLDPACSPVLVLCLGLRSSSNSPKFRFLEKAAMIRKSLKLSSLSISFLHSRTKRSERGLYGITMGSIGLLLSLLLLLLFGL